MVENYWDCQPCGAAVSKRAKYSREYFDDIESFRYRIEPEILSFADFQSFTGKEVLEVGVGTGTDFLQWLRAGARATGIDLSPEAIEHSKKRLEIYGLQAQEVRLGDALSLPYPDDRFDLVYSWGVIHHTANPVQALSEIVRVTRPGGICKLMLYNRYSLIAFYCWLKYALLRGRPWKSLTWVISHHIESAGTSAFTKAEVRRILARLPVAQVQMQTQITHYDYLGHFGLLTRLCAKALTTLIGHRAGWFTLIRCVKTTD